MIIRSIIVLIIALIWQSAIAQVIIEGISFPSTYKAGNSQLVLNGGGVREKYFMDMYVVGLYLPAKNNEAEAITRADMHMAIRLHIVSGLITSEKMIEAVEQGFAKSGNVEILRSRIDQFIDLYRETLKKGDYFDLVYIPSKGTVILKNGAYKATITGLDFKQALFGIWLGKVPADDDLKESMLGL